MSDTNEPAAADPVAVSPLDRFRGTLQAKLAAVKAELPYAENGDPRATVRALHGVVELFEHLVAGPEKSDPSGA